MWLQQQEQSSTNSIFPFFPLQQELFLGASPWQVLIWPRWSWSCLCAPFPGAGNPVGLCSPPWCCRESVLCGVRGAGPPQFQPASDPIRIPWFPDSPPTWADVFRFGSSVGMVGMPGMGCTQTRFDLLERIRLGEGSVQTVNIWGGLCSPR